MQPGLEDFETAKNIFSSNPCKIRRQWCLASVMPGRTKAVREREPSLEEPGANSRDPGGLGGSV
jgi:hypothetical protein